MRFPAMSAAYDAQLRALANQVADELSMKSCVYDGVYVYQAGPCYETIAECRMLRCLGGDVVGTVDIIVINPFNADPIKALHFAILV